MPQLDTTIVRSVTYIVSVFLRFLVCILFFQQIFPWKKWCKHKALISIAVPAALTIVEMIVSIVMLSVSAKIPSVTYSFWPFAIINLLYFALFLFFFEGSKYRKILILLLFTALVWLLEFAITNLLTFFDAPLPPGLLQYTGALLSRPLTFGICCYIAHYTRKYPLPYKIPVGYWIVIYVLLLFEYFCAIILNDLLTFNKLIDTPALLMQWGLLLIIGVTYQGFFQICQNYQKTVQHSLTEQQLRVQKAHFLESHQVFESLRELQHEFKNHIFYMDYLLEKHDYQKLEDYFADYRKKLEALRFIESGNSVINAVLNQKQRIAKQKGIEFTIDTTGLPEQSGIEDIDLCTVLSNLLDNAIEASEQQKNARIVVTMKTIRNHLHIIIKNAVSEDVLEVNPLLQTTKENKEQHGLGLNIIRAIAEKYNGILNFSSEDGYFTTTLTLQQSA